MIKISNSSIDYDICKDRHLVSLRDTLNKCIKDGFNQIADHSGKMFTCTKAFISKIHGYNKVFLLSVDGHIIDAC